jgi:hypothetical protein
MKRLHHILDWLLLPKSTIELADLNEIWNRFNEGEDVMEELLRHRWKYQLPKVRMLVDLHFIRKNTH